MIKKEELRIGNTILHEIEFENFVLHTVDSDTLRWLEVDEKTFNLVHKPIPLTEELLIDRGFDYSSKLSDNDCMVYYLDNGLEIVWVGYLCVDINGLFIPLADTELKHLHELENLYYDLTKKELICLKK